MKTKIEIEYSWWDEFGDEPTQSDIIEILDDEAFSHINEMRNEGMTSGELNYTVDFGEASYTEFSGWWGLTTKRVED